MSNKIMDYNSSMEIKDKKQRFGLNLSKARNRKNISEYELSLQLDKDPTYINKIENGKSFPSVAVIYQIMEILEIDANELFNLK